jgi:hypothetical protein
VTSRRYRTQEVASEPASIPSRPCPSNEMYTTCSARDRFEAIREGSDAGAVIDDDTSAVLSTIPTRDRIERRLVELGAQDARSPTTLSDRGYSSLCGVFMTPWSAFDLAS